MTDDVETDSDRAVGSEETQPAPKHPVLVVAGWAIVGVAMYYLIRLAVLFVFSLPFLVLPKTPVAAGMWLLVFEPIGLGAGAYLTLMTNADNKLFHTVLTVVVFASAVIGHVTWGLGNAFVTRANGGAVIAAWIVQAALVILGGVVATRRLARRASTAEGAGRPASV